MFFLSFSASIAIFLLHFQGPPLCFAFVSPLSVALLLQHPQEGSYDICLNLGGEIFCIKFACFKCGQIYINLFLYKATWYSNSVDGQIESKYNWNCSLCFFVVNNGFHRSHCSLH